MRMTQPSTPLQALIEAYHSMLQSYILYGLIVWASITKKHLSSIQVLQNKAIRNVFGIDKTTRINDVYKTTNLLPIEELIKSSINIPIMSNTILLNNNNFHGYDTRSSNHLRQLNINTTKFCTSSIRNKITNFYNKIPNEYKSLNKTQFKKCIKKFIKTEYDKS